MFIPPFLYMCRGSLCLWLSCVLERPNQYDYIWAISFSASCLLFSHPFCFMAHHDFDISDFGCANTFLLSLIFLFPLISNAFGLLDLIRNSGNILGFSIGWTVPSLLFQFPCYITNLYIGVYSFSPIRESRLISYYFHCYNVRP